MLQLVSREPRNYPRSLYQIKMDMKDKLVVYII